MATLCMNRLCPRVGTEWGHQGRQEARLNAGLGGTDGVPPVAAPSTFSAGEETLEPECSQAMQQRRNKSPDKAGAAAAEVLEAKASPRVMWSIETDLNGRLTGHSHSVLRHWKV